LYLRGFWNHLDGSCCPLSTRGDARHELKAYFTYTVVKGMGVPWETAQGVLFLSGVVFLILTQVGVGQWIMAAVYYWR